MLCFFWIISPHRGLCYTKLNTVFGFCKILTVFETNNCGHKKRTSAYTIFVTRNSVVSVVEAWKSRLNKQKTITRVNDCLHFVVANVENRQKAYDFACYHKIKQRPQHEGRIHSKKTPFFSFRFILNWKYFSDLMIDDVTHSSQDVTSINDHLLFLEMLLS